MTNTNITSDAFLTADEWFRAGKHPDDLLGQMVLARHSSTPVMGMITKQNTTKRQVEVVSSLGVSWESPHSWVVVPTANRLNGQKFVFTGAIRFEREFAKKIVTLMGGEFKNSITNDTDYLVCGSNVGKSKTDKAKKKGIKMLTENEFFELFS